MLKRELDKKVVAAALAAAVITFAGLGFTGYKFYHQKQVNEIVARSAWLRNREAGVPLSMEASPDASPKEREQARRLAMEQMQWGGKSEVEASAPTPAPAPATTVATSIPIPTSIVNSSIPVPTPVTTIPSPIPAS